MKRFNITYFKLNRIIFTVVILGVAGFFIYLPDYTRFKNLRKENNRLKDEIKELKEEITNIEENLKRLDKDPSFWEQITRKHMKVLKENEILVDINSQKE